MTTDRFWTPLIILLVVIIAVGGIFAWSQYQDSQAADPQHKDQIGADQRFDGALPF